MSSLLNKNNLSKNTTDDQSNTLIIENECMNIETYKEMHMDLNNLFKYIDDNSKNNMENAKINKYILINFINKYQNLKNDYVKIFSENTLLNIEKET